MKTKTTFWDPSEFLDSSKSIAAYLETESLAVVVNRKTAETIWRHFHEPQPVDASK
jgi:hypothetical protein